MSEVEQLRKEVSELRERLAKLEAKKSLAEELKPHFKNPSQPQDIAPWKQYREAPIWLSAPTYGDGKMMNGGGSSC